MQFMTKGEQYKNKHCAFNNLGAFVASFGL